MLCLLKGQAPMPTTDAFRRENFGLIGQENDMEYATLGNTGLLVSKLCFGTMTFGDGRGLFKAISTVGQSGADELVKTSIDGGINFFDTADNYTEGESEKILGQSLKNLNIARKDVVIATKVYSRVVGSRQTSSRPGSVQYLEYEK
jgi:aryl-alcohol dehydrogenase-like predicted oxidoreductase